MRGATLCLSKPFTTPQLKITFWVSNSVLWSRMWAEPGLLLGRRGLKHILGEECYKGNYKVCWGAWIQVRRLTRGAAYRAAREDTQGAQERGLTRLTFGYVCQDLHMHLQRPWKNQHCSGGQITSRECIMWWSSNSDMIKWTLTLHSQWLSFPAVQLLSHSDGCCEDTACCSSLWPLIPQAGWSLKSSCGLFPTPGLQVPAWRDQLETESCFELFTAVVSGWILAILYFMVTVSWAQPRWSFLWLWRLMLHSKVRAERWMLAILWLQTFLNDSQLFM